MRLVAKLFAKPLALLHRKSVGFAAVIHVIEGLPQRIAQAQRAAGLPAILADPAKPTKPVRAPPAMRHQEAL